MSHHGKFHSLRVKLLRRGRTPNPIGILLARMFGNRLLGVAGAPWKDLTNASRKCFDVRAIECGAPLRAALPCHATALGIRQALLFRPNQRLFLDQHALTFVPLPGATETNDDGAKR